MFFEYNKLEIYWVEQAFPGHLAIMPHPTGGRSLSGQVCKLAGAEVGTVVSLLTEEENDLLDLTSEAELCEQAGLRFVSFPVTDWSVPDSLENTRRLADKLARELREGSNVVIHCRAGIGRSALLAACVLVRGGLVADAACTLLSVARGVTVPATSAQRNWLTLFERAGRDGDEPFPE